MNCRCNGVVEGLKEEIKTGNNVDQEPTLHFVYTASAPSVCVGGISEPCERASSKRRPVNCRCNGIVEGLHGEIKNGNNVDQEPTLHFRIRSLCPQRLCRGHF